MDCISLLHCIAQVFDVRGFLALHNSKNNSKATTNTAESSSNVATASSAVTVSSSSSIGTIRSYYPLVDGKVCGYICSIPAVSAIIGTTVPTEIQSSEIGDGNLNLVFLCK